MPTQIFRDGDKERHWITGLPLAYSLLTTCRGALDYRMAISACSAYHIFAAEATQSYITHHWLDTTYIIFRY